jgi:hypothetical protein
VVEGAFDSKLRKTSMTYTASPLTPLPPHFVRSPLPAIAGRDADGVARISRCIASGKIIQPANSRERSVAAAMASLISLVRPLARIRTASAAAVVPPGEVTFWRSVAASWRD